ncbi:MAG TPA: FecR domain-containing protein [Opitutaceae bacterium]|nr:FecR domain-containing protein [Opitutaceae bacterium]
MNTTSHVRTAAEIDATARNWILRRESGLSADEQAEFERWRMADLRHAEALTRCSQAWSLLDQPRLGGRAPEMIRMLSVRAGRKRRRRVALGATAVFALLIVGFFWNAQLSLPSRSPASAVVLVPEQRLLPDGGTVELRAGAEIAVDYSGPLRRVTLLRGEALFHVAENKDRPFVVAAAEIEVRAVGTAFLVQLSGELINVVGTHGRVAVERPASSTALPAEFSTLVDAGSRVAVSRPRPVAPQVTVLDDDELADRLAWRVPWLEFSDTLLAEAVGLLNRHSTIQLVVADAELARLPVNGRFRADNSEAFVRILERSFGVKADRLGETITLTKTP